jgi:hypothetical protein
MLIRGYWSQELIPLWCWSRIFDSCQNGLISSPLPSFLYGSLSALKPEPAGLTFQPASWWLYSYSYINLTSSSYRLLICILQSSTCRSSNRKLVVFKKKSKTCYTRICKAAMQCHRREKLPASGILLPDWTHDQDSNSFLKKYCRDYRDLFFF